MLKMMIFGELLAVLGAGCFFYQEYGGARPSRRDRSSAPADAAGPDAAGGTAVMVGPRPPRPPLPALADPRVLVEKSACRLTLCDGRRVIRIYPVIAGSGTGDKTCEGDRCTPEGEFYICMKNPQSKYLLSLGLSYPNEEDAARGLSGGLISSEEYNQIVLAVRMREQPPWYTPLGGEIMIHGCKAGRDSTAGCVAMDDDDVRELFDALPIGTPVEVTP